MGEDLLAASLARTLWALVRTPADRIDGPDAETFVPSVYRAALRRDPSPDDLRRASSPPSCATSTPG